MAWRVARFVRGSQQGLLRGVLEGDGVALDVALFCQLRRGCELRLGEAGEGGFVPGHEDAFFGGGEEFVGKGIGERGKFLR